MNNAIYPLFPCPLMICGTTYAFSTAEQKFIADLPMVDNIGNAMSEDDRVLESVELSDLKRFIEAQILNYKKNLLRIKDENEIYITQSWVNQSRADQYHPKHKHPNSIVSGVMFLNENKDCNLPAIGFHRTLQMFPVDFCFDELNEFNAPSREFDPEQGMLLLFPSLVEHDVGKNTSSQTRNSLSFNTYVRGTVGGRSQLTEVEIS